MRLSPSRAAMWLGTIMLAAGILGFVPGITQNYYLFHFIKVGVGPNIVHLVIGALALAVAAREVYARAFLQAVAIAYLVTGIIGLFIPDGQVYGFLDSNWWTEAARGLIVLGAASVAWDWSSERLAAPRTAPSFGETMEDDREL